MAKYKVDASVPECPTCGATMRPAQHRGKPGPSVLLMTAVEGSLLLQPVLWRVSSSVNTFVLATSSDWDKVCVVHRVRERCIHFLS